jgi:hypothetical protein
MSMQGLSSRRTENHGGEEIAERRPRPQEVPMRRAVLEAQLKKHAPM